MGWIYPSFCVVVISTVYATFLFCNLLPQLHAVNAAKSGKTVDGFAYVPSESELYGVTVSFHVIFAMMITCFVLASTSEPGYIPTKSNEDQMRWIEGEFDITEADDTRVKNTIQDTNADLTDPATILWLKSIVILERKKQYGYYRHCSACNLYKPDRTHHCRICDTCVLRMDHHCPWIANCVGYNNYKYFLLLLFYVIACLSFVLGGMSRRLGYAFRPILDTNEFLFVDLPVCIIYLLCMFLFIAVCMFFTFHMNLTLNNMTTIELREKKNNTDPYVKHRFAVAHIKFDDGYWKNFTNIFGPPWMWFLPIFPGGQGTYVPETSRKHGDQKAIIA